jgi:feruloyl esterase
MSKNTLRALGVAGTLSLALGGSLGTAALPGVAPAVTLTSDQLETLCQPERVQAAVSRLAATAVTVKAITDGPNLPGGTQFTATTATMPAFCQVTGSFVTNAKAGKTANFLATFPANWNGRYLQLGCSGLCGNFYVSNAAVPSITVTTQGYPGQILQKGYASFATDEGHESLNPREWAVRKDGSVDQEELIDLYYRADKLLARMGKEFTLAFYAPVKTAPTRIVRSYFTGCSGGGRDAYVAAAHFPEEFDGIIGASPYSYLPNSVMAAAFSAAAARSPDARVTPAHMQLLNPIVNAQCDGLDGVKDGIIQNPMACNFRPERDLPRCEGDKPGAQCFTKAQIETVSVFTNGVTDEQGNVVATGYSVSELLAKGGGPAGSLADAVMNLFTYKNDPKFSRADLFTFRAGGPGQVTAFHAVIPAAEAARIKNEVRMGSGEFAEDADRLIRLDRKLLLWSNLSDNTLLPYTGVNYYKQLAARHGGYAKLQRNVRLFLLPGTDHCSITSIAPNGFDPLTAIEDWVEKRRPPSLLMASVANRQFSPGMPGGEAQKFPKWTMPLCKFPTMARYNGTGDVKDGANWSCPASDTRMLQVGESGKQAGVVM